MTDYNNLQTLMNTAYAKFTKGRNREEWFEELDYKERCAVAIGNLNYQVENGGFAQWADNGYAALNGAFAVRFMRKHGEDQMADLVVQAMDVLQDVINDCGTIFSEEPGEDALEALDSEFYATNAAWLVRVDAILGEAP